MPYPERNNQRSMQTQLQNNTAQRNGCKNYPKERAQPGPLVIVEEYTRASIQQPVSGNGNRQLPPPQDAEATLGSGIL